MEMEKWTTFWNAVFDHFTLVGLLYGFGLKNSSNFSRKYQDHMDDLNPHFSDKLYYGKVSVSQFPLPIFASFSEGTDEIIEQYKKNAC